MEHWKRKQMRLNYRWDLTGFEEEEVSGLGACAPAILGPLETSLDWGPGGCVGEMGQARTWALPRGTQRAETGSKMGAKPLPS